MIATPSTHDASSPGVLDFYRALAGAVASGWSRVSWVVEAGAIVAWFALRTIDLERPAMLAWTFGTALLALLSPLSGLVVIAGIAPFNEGLLITRDVGVKPVLVVIVVASIGARIVVSRREWRRPSLPVVLAVVLLVTSAGGLLVSRDRFGGAFAFSAAQIWFTGIATAFMAFLAAVGASRGGSLRPLAVIGISATVAVILSLVDYGFVEAFRAGPLGWITSGEPMVVRLTGVTRSPTATATIVLLPLCLSLAALALGRDRRLRLAGALVSVPLLVAAYYTYSRAIFVALFAFAVTVAWRIRPRYGVMLVVAGALVGALLLPAYMDLRTESVGMTPEPGQVLLANDRQRLNGWATAIRMFVDSPLVGQGYRAYREVAASFGDPVLLAPHNEWLRLFAENGAVVGLAGLAFVSATAVRLWRVPGWLGVGIFGAFASFVLCACFNNPFLFNQVTIPAFVIAGTGVSLAGRSGPAPPSAERGPPGATEGP